MVYSLGVHFTKRFDLASTLRNPRFTEGVASYTHVAYQKELMVILDLRYITRDGKVQPGGWTLFPVFLGDEENQATESRNTPPVAVDIGYYLVPLFAGEVNPTLLDILGNDESRGSLEHPSKSKSTAVANLQSQADSIVDINDAIKDLIKVRPILQSRT